MSRSRYTLLIHFRDNFRVYLECAHPAFLTLLVVLVVIGKIKHPSKTCRGHWSLSHHPTIRKVFVAIILVGSCDICTMLDQIRQLEKHFTQCPHFLYGFVPVPAFLLHSYIQQTWKSQATLQQSKVAL